MAPKRRRKLDQYLRGVREDPDVVLQRMTMLSNRVFRLIVGLILTGVLVFLVIWPSEGFADLSLTLGVAILLFTVTCLGWLAAGRIQPGVFDRPAHFNQLIFLIFLTVLLSLAIFKMGWSPFLAPLPMLSMVLAITFGQPVALFLVPTVGFYLGLLYPRATGAGLEIDIVRAVSLFLGGMVSVLGMSRVRQQSRPVVVGAGAGLVQGLLVLAFKVSGVGGGGRITLAHLDSLAGVGQFLQEPAWAVAGGLISGALVTCFLPALERLFGVVTERRLLALTDPSNQLLEVLRTRAPGTHTHSLRVADLAAAAAEAIGADPLLSRVGAYYHDIGKIEKAEYFVENRESGQSIHDRLRPSMSKLVIISHVKEGVELAEEAKLPQKVIDMIPMHHGTTVVEYFYHKAKTEGDASESEVEYRYPGPKPRFREAGILMLADGAEATAKSIADPNPHRFRTMVHDLILKRLLDHQLDECDLTMRDLTRIEDSLVRTLTYMHHGRIKYPEKESPPGPDQGGRGPPGEPPNGLRRPPQGPSAPEGPPPPRPERGHETRDYHRQPAEVSAARSGPPAKDPLGDSPGR